MINKINNEREARWLVRDYLELVLNGDYILYNSVQKQEVEVTEDRIEHMIDIFLEELAGHGIKHLHFIQQEYAKHTLNNNLQVEFNKYIKGS